MDITTFTVLYILYRCINELQCIHGHDSSDGLLSTSSPCKVQVRLLQDDLLWDALYCLVLPKASYAKTSKLILHRYLNTYIFLFHV